MLTNRKQGWGSRQDAQMISNGDPQVAMVGTRFFSDKNTPHLTRAWSRCAGVRGSCLALSYAEQMSGIVSVSGLFTHFPANKNNYFQVREIGLKTISLRIDTPLPGCLQPWTSTLFRRNGLAHPHGMLSEGGTVCAWTCPAPGVAEGYPAEGSSTISTQFGFLPIGYALSLVSCPPSASIR